MSEETGTYLGQKGYSIYKECLDLEEQKWLRETLTVKPSVPSSPVQPPSFPIYRESANKFYIPRFFGNNTYGDPTEMRLSVGTPTNINFNGDLRDYQKNIVATYLNNAKKGGDFGGGGLLEIPCGRGKCLGINTPIMMYDGTIKMVQDVKTGDILMGDDSTPRNVLSLARGLEMMYKIVSKDGSYSVNESHILSLKKATNRGDAIVDMSVKEYLNITKTSSEAFYGYSVPISFPYADVRIHPYLLGYYLFANCCHGGIKDALQITIASRKIVKRIERYLVEIHPSLYLIYDSTNNLYTISSSSRDGLTIFYNCLTYYGMLSKNKYIPHIYKCNSREIRENLLAGIVASAGHFEKHKIIIKTHHASVDDILFIARSLGYRAKLKENNIHIYYSSDTSLKYEIKVVKLKVDDYYGFEIDGNRRFVLGDFTVTHNTVIALNIITQLKTKTLVIVHKGFLLNQWIERITQFIPNARVGKIQGKTLDIEDKDIVIGMLQSLSMKEYPQDIFSSFGLTIVDECHHISSEVFSRSLQKIVTKYVLGLSATMQRNDGLTRVFKMFLGEIIYKEERDKTDTVLVKACEFVSADDEFNTTEHDFRGNVAYSTMISKLCSFSSRSEFILKVLKNEMIEKPNQQIMILAHNKNVLEYLFDAIEHRNMATVGYYLGGMKESELKKTESKQVIIATYAMASEALDIKTLTTLILATPRTNVIQSVGRILRVKHDRPLVVDILDTHDVFKRQWLKRRKFYEKNNYKIIQTNSHKYELNKWKTLNEPALASASSTQSCIKQKTDKPVAVNRKCLIQL